MANVEKISVALPPDMVGLLRAAVASGEYASASEVIREAMRDWKMKRKIAELDVEDLRRLVQDGIESGPAVDAETVFARLCSKYAGLRSGE